MAGRTTSAKAAPPVPVEVRGRARTLVSRTEAQRLGRELGRALVAAGESGAEMTLSLVDDDEIHALNRDYRDKDKPTDVLSFSMREGEGGTLHPELLGDVVISVETAARQAAEAARPLADELLHLAVHGLAHLCGYDHATLAEERVMFAWEAELRAAARPVPPVGPVRSARKTARAAAAGPVAPAQRAARKTRTQKT